MRLGMTKRNMHSHTGGLAFSPDRPGAVRRQTKASIAGVSSFSDIVGGFDRRAMRWLSDQGRTVDALASASEEGRGRLRKATVSRQTDPDPWISEWGNPSGVTTRHHPPNS